MCIAMVIVDLTTWQHRISTSKQESRLNKLARLQNYSGNEEPRSCSSWCGQVLPALNEANGP